MATTLYNRLPLYADGNLAQLTDQYNKAINIIDRKLYTLQSQIEMLQTTINALQLHAEPEDNNGKPNA